MFYDLRWEVIVRFVDIGWIIEYYSLNILYTIEQQEPQ